MKWRDGNVRNKETFSDVTFTIRAHKYNWLCQIFGVFFVAVQNYTISQSRSLSIPFQFCVLHIQRRLLHCLLLVHLCRITHRATQYTHKYTHREWDVVVVVVDKKRFTVKFNRQTCQMEHGNPSLCVHVQFLGQRIQFQSQITVRTYSNVRFIPIVPTYAWGSIRCYFSHINFYQF